MDPRVSSKVDGFYRDLHSFPTRRSSDLPWQGAVARHEERENSVVHKLLSGSKVIGVAIGNRHNDVVWAGGRLARRTRGRRRRTLAMEQGSDVAIRNKAGVEATAAGGATR